VDPTGDLTFATFNIQHGRGRDGIVDLARTAGFVASLGADLVALQEVDKDLTRSGHVDQAAELAQRTGIEVHFFPAALIEQGEYGQALAASGPLDATIEPLPRLADEERRIAIVARYRGVSVVATHLAQRGRARELQTEALATLVGRLDEPVVVLGDLNQRIGSLTPLISAGFTTSPRPGSLGARFTARRIDHILVGPAARIRKLHVVPTDASDHYGAVWARVGFTRGT
jgi:endonuclease/exonuclease/phosphatase family metal-dependent hydrolase